jgi:tetratricopeptide (TPR) repeat protein
LARRAIDLAKEDANIQWMAGFAIWVLGLDTQGARELFRRSLLANPNSSIALTMFGWVEAVNGNPAECRRMIERALRLNPRHPHDWQMSTGMTIAYIADKRFEEAVVWGEKAHAQYPHSAVVLRAFIVALAHSGNVGRAREIVRQLLAIEPDLTISLWRKSIAIGDQNLTSIYADGLRKAGLPES